MLGNLRILRLLGSLQDLNEGGNMEKHEWKTLRISLRV